MTTDAAAPPGRDPVATLRRYKAFAAMILLIAAVAWLATHLLALPPLLLAYLRAGAEAGIVGGLADWFAITALFRHPLGLPIPHTSLIPRNQTRIAEGVATYIDREFLRRDMLIDRIRRFDIADRMSRLLDAAEDRRRLVEGLTRFLPHLLDSRGDGGMREALARALGEGLAQADLRAPLARLLRGVVEGKELAALIREASEELRLLVRASEPAILDRVSQRSWWFIPRAVDRRLAGLIIEGLLEHLEALKDPDSPEGMALRDWLESLPGLIESSQGIGQRLAELVKRAAADREVARIAAALWADLKQIIRADLGAPDSKIRALLEAVAASLADQLDKAPLRREINAAVESLLSENVPAWRAEIRAFITETLNRQTPKDFARRLELQVGRDLQYIRVNGTVIGALIGVAIELANRAW